MPASSNNKKQDQSHDDIYRVNLAFVTLWIDILYLVTWQILWQLIYNAIMYGYPDSKVHGVNMGPTWFLSAPDCPHVRPINLAIRVCNNHDVKSIRIDLSHKPHSASDKYPTIHNFVAEMCTHVHIFYKLVYCRAWDMGLVNCGICATSLLSCSSFE